MSDSPFYSAGFPLIILTKKTMRNQIDGLYTCLFFCTANEFWIRLKQKTVRKTFNNVHIAAILHINTSFDVGLKEESRCVQNVDTCLLKRLWLDDKHFTALTTSYHIFYHYTNLWFYPKFVRRNNTNNLENVRFKNFKKIK